MSTITLSVNGTPFESYKRVIISKSLDKLCGEFSFTAVDPDQFRFPFKVGDSCEVAIDNEPIITGFIDKIEGHYSTQSHELIVSGRDKTSDVADSTVGGTLSFRAPISLEDVIIQTLKGLGISGILVSNLVPGLEQFSQGELILPKIGDTVFKFLENFARKRQVLLTTSARGELIITRSSEKVVDQYVLNKIKGDFNNVLSAKFTYDKSARFNKYVFWSQANTATLNAEFDANAANAKTDEDTPTNLEADLDASLLSATNISSVASTAFDSAVRASRVLNKLAEKSMQEDDLKKRATWEGNVRRARSIVYSPTLQGVRYAPSHPLWALNTLVHVADSFANIEATMLVNHITFTLDSTEGTTTTLGLIDSEAYKVKLEIDKADQKANKLAPDLVFDPVAANARDTNSDG